MLNLNSLDLEQIAEALEDQSADEHRWLLDPRSGEVVFWSRDGGIDGDTPIDLDDVDLLPINPIPSYVWHQDMADFADGITDDHAARRLGRAIDGRGAFRRFRGELSEEYPHLLPAWHEFRDTRARRRAVEWLADTSLVDGNEAARFLDEHRDPALP